MANLTFTYRSDTPASRRIFQDNRARFLQLGAIRIDDGFVTDELGRTTTYAVLRPLAFTDPSIPYRSSLINPGDRGLTPLQFRRGRVSVLPPQSKQVLLTSSPTHQFLNGRVTVVGVVAGGLLTDFAVWNATQQDPADFYVESATDLDSGGVTQPWTRNNAIFVPHKNARYLAVGTKAYNLSNSGIYRNHYVKKWMVEKTEVGRNAPTAKYGKAREIVVKVRPSRVNLFPNPSFDVSDTSVSLYGGATKSLVSDPGGSGNYLRVVRGTAGAGLLAMLYPVPYSPNGLVSFSLKARLDAAHAASVQEFQFQIVSYSSGTGKGTAVGGIRVARLTKSWSEVKIDGARLPADTSINQIGIQIIPNSSMAATDAINIDDIIVEATPKVGPFFSGSTSADTIWERGGTVGLSRSYLYKNRVDRYAAIQRVLEDNVPLGIGIAEPIFGVLPSDWIPT